MNCRLISKGLLLTLATSLATSNVMAIGYDYDSAVIAEEDDGVNEYFYNARTILQAIENLPDEVISMGAHETAAWLQDETGFLVSVDDDGNLQFADPYLASYDDMLLRASIPGCIGAVGIALISNGIPFLKILKVRSALKALGGTKKAITKIKKYYDDFRRKGNSRSNAIKKALNKASSSLGKDAQKALLDFFNLSNVAANCF